jgi:hypothetical protein
MTTPLQRRTPSRIADVTSTSDDSAGVLALAGHSPKLRVEGASPDTQPRAHSAPTSK